MLNDFFRRLIGKSGSKDAAKKRLKFALIYDKLEVSDDTLENLQRDIVEVISRYFEIDKASVKLDIQREDDVSALVEYKGLPIKKASKLVLKKLKAAGATGGFIVVDKKGNLAWPYTSVGMLRGYVNHQGELKTGVFKKMK